MSLQIDANEFSKALAQYSRLSKSTLPTILNRKGLFIVKGAMDRTPRAVLPSITKDIGTPAKPKRLAYAIFNARNPGLKGEALKTAVRRMVARRRSATGFEKSGWVGAGKAFARALREYFKGRSKRMKPADQGKARPARNGWSPVAEFSYNKPVKDASGGMLILPETAAALRDAWRHELADMKRVILERMQKDADKVNAR